MIKLLPESPISHHDPLPLRARLARVAGLRGLEPGLEASPFRKGPRGGRSGAETQRPGETERHTRDRDPRKMECVLVKGWDGVETSPTVCMCVCVRETCAHTCRLTSLIARHEVWVAPGT